MNVKDNRRQPWTPNANSRTRSSGLFGSQDRRWRLGVIILVCSIGFLDQAWAVYTKDRLSATPVAAGSRHSFALEDGGVWGWGFDWDGRLGNGQPQAYVRLLPERVTRIDGVVALVAGPDHTLARLTNGTVWAWGENSSGQLGNGSTEATNLPVQVPGLSNIVALATGAGHSLALDAVGRVWAWGRNSSGQLGTGTSLDSTVPILVPALSNITVIGAGWGHSLAADGTGQVWAWGANGYGQLGLGVNSDYEATPSLVPGLAGIRQLCAGTTHTTALDTNGHVWAWGRDISGQLGVGPNWADSSVPLQVTTISNMVGLAAGPDHNLSLDGKGVVWAWGRNHTGQLGDGTNNNSFIPIRVSSVPDEIAAIAAGTEHSLAVTKHGQVFGWGNNSEGRLGNGLATWNSNPVAPVLAVFHHSYRILVVMLSRYDTGPDCSAIVADMNRLVADIRRYSYGKVSLSYDLAGPYNADPIADIGCNGNDMMHLVTYAITNAAARGVNVSGYAHVIVEVHNDLGPECVTSQSGGFYTGGGLTNTGVTVLLPGAFAGTQYNRHVVAHEFLHGYGNCLIPHVELLDCGCNAAYQPNTNTAFINPFCARTGFHCAMDIMGLPAAANNADTGPNVNAIYKEALGWLPRSAIATVTNSGSFDLYPMDDSGFTNGRLYMLKLPVLGITPQGLPQQFALEYRKQALIGRSSGALWPGVYPFLSQTMYGSDVPFAFILRTQPADPATRDGITPLATNTPTMLDPAGLVVEVASLNESFARVNISFDQTIRPVLRDFVRADNECSFEICGIRSGVIVKVERSWDLPSNLWETAATFLSDGHPAHWSERLSPGQPAAYYRVRIE